MTLHVFIYTGKHEFIYIFNQMFLGSVGGTTSPKTVTITFAVNSRGFSSTFPPRFRRIRGRSEDRRRALLTIIHLTLKTSEPEV